jgi:hypothetical protein
MTIQRQYTLPHCNLILEGLSANATDPLSPMSVLMNVECQLPGATDATLTGGREFLDRLVAAVSHYGQQLLSGVNRPTPTPGDSPPLVDLKPGDGPYHHLIVRQQNSGESPPQDTEATAPLDVRLSTVQFYDLMEAVDQLLADGQTLPDLQAQFQAVPRRLVKPAEPAAKRAAPAAIGAAALAAAGISLFFVPPPDFEPSRSNRESEASADTIDAVPSESAISDEDRALLDEQSSAPDDDSGTAAEGTDPEAAATGLDRLADAPVISDPSLLATLRRNLSRRLQADWTVDPAPAEVWTYRVALAENGDVLGYKYQNAAALDNVASTPLARLAFEPVDDTQPVQEPVAQFEVSFTPEGEVEVLPWGDTATAPNAAGPDDASEALAPAEAETSPGDAREAAAAEPVTANIGETTAAGQLPNLDEAITDGETIRTLNRSLYDSILSELTPLSANEPLEYRVRVSEDGDIVGYEALNAAGVLLDDETPLPTLVAPGGTADLQADYRVVFTEEGVLEVSPWDGWPD